MFDMFHLTSEEGVDFQQFWPLTASTGSRAATMQWRKPQNAKIVGMIAIGGGGGGGGGFTGAAGTARGGGGGGGPGAITRVIYPARFLPDELWVWAMFGGAGSTGSGVAGSAGGDAGVSATPGNTSGANVFCYSAGGSGGGAGTGAAAGTAGAVGAATVITNSTMPFGHLALSFLSNTGVVAGAGGAQTGAAGASVSPLNTGVICGGAGGGGTPIANTDFAGGGSNATSIADLHPARAGGTAAGGNGDSGLWIPRPFFTIGGLGGGTNGAAGTGGKGGDGVAPGTGGGGGGAGVTGGGGGNGGPGWVGIWAW